MKYKVTFHRTYEIDEQQIYDELSDRIDYTEGREYSDEEIKDTAEEIARGWFVEEAPEFLDNSEDFVSATIELIE